MRESTTRLRKCMAETAGTFILVFFGVGSVHASVLTGAQEGIWQVAVVWGVAISLAIYATGALSGAHMNPAITASFAVFRGPIAIPGPRGGFFTVYIVSPILGALVGAAAYQGLVASALLPVRITQRTKPAMSRCGEPSS